MEMLKTRFFAAAYGLFGEISKHFPVDFSVEKILQTFHIFVNSTPTRTFQQFDIFLSVSYALYSTLFLFDLFDNLLYLRLVAVYGADIRFHLLYGGEDGGVVSSEYLADFLQRKVGKLLYNVYRDVARVCDAVGFFL